jgi:hypothetical protein
MYGTIDRTGRRQTTGRYVVRMPPPVCGTDCAAPKKRAAYPSPAVTSSESRLAQVPVWPTGTPTVIHVMPDEHFAGQLVFTRLLLPV